jgi:hypothetical protein
MCEVGPRSPLGQHAEPEPIRSFWVLAVHAADETPKAARDVGIETSVMRGWMNIRKYQPDQPPLICVWQQHQRNST